MVIKMNKIDITQELKGIFANVNMWLHFAEAKNGALIAFNMSLITFITTSETNDFIILLIVLSLLLSLLSFIPNFNLFGKFFLSKNLSKENLVYYEHILNYSKEEYLKRICEKCNVNIKETSDMHLDYADEIIINSKITSTKYNIFKCAIILTIVAILIFLFFDLFNVKEIFDMFISEFVCKKNI